MKSDAVEKDVLRRWRAAAEIQGLEKATGTAGPLRAWVFCIAEQRNLRGGIPPAQGSKFGYDSYPIP
jgi:hypothetical protein